MKPLKLSGKMLTIPIVDKPEENIPVPSAQMIIPSFIRIFVTPEGATRVEIIDSKTDQTSVLELHLSGESHMIEIDTSAIVEVSTRDRINNTRRLEYTYHPISPTMTEGTI